jgi:UDP-N-acetylmuramate dehydrogenase
MILQADAPLQAYNTFGIAAKAALLARIIAEDDVHELLARDDFGRTPKLVLGGGSNLVFTRDVDAVVMKMEIGGLAVVDETPDDWVVQAGSGVDWHELVRWTVTQGYPGLENMALIPGTVGAAPVQNIGAYGMELQNRFHSLDAIDLRSGKDFTLQAAQCGFGYRDSVFKHAPAATGGMGLKGAAVITQVRFALPKRWRPELAYQDLQRKVDESGISQPSAQQVFDWVVDIRTAKLPDPRDVGNAGSFFKNPTVSQEQCDDIIGRDPRVVHYPLGDGRIKLAAGWLIDACGWKGKTIGRAGVYDKQALVLVNRGTRESPVTGGEVMTLARAIQTSVYERFGIMLEPEPEVI